MPEIQFLGEKTLFNCQAIVCCKWAYCWSIMSIENLSYESWRFLVKFIAGTCTMYIHVHMCMYLCMHHRTGCPNKVILYQAGEDKSCLYACACRIPSLGYTYTWEDCNRTDHCVKCRPNYVWMKWYWMLIQKKEMIEQFPCLAR